MYSHQLLYNFLFLCVIFFTCKYAQSQIPIKQRPFNNTIPALFVFGDSTVDAGNNNFIKTSMKSNFPPYGRDFINHIPTGRFTNGRLVPDFIVSYTGIKDIVPAYLDPTLTIADLMTGVCFASAGSGYDPLTATLSNVISLEQQVEYFKEYKSKMEIFIGKERTQDIISKSIFMLSAGTNDYVLNYFSLGRPITQEIYPNVSSYTNFLLQNIEQFIKEMMNEGARKIAMVGLPPMGCLPEVITMNRVSGRKCVEEMQSIARDYNEELGIRLKAMQTSQTKLYFADIYKPILDMVQLGNKLGFQEVNVGCCGTGYFEYSITCNMNSALCDDASKYVFWDAVHPTENAYHYMYTSFLPVINTVINDSNK